MISGIQLTGGLKYDNARVLRSYRRKLEAVLGRLHSEALIRRFALKFLEDQSYIQLKQALENKNYEDAFRGAHTLKGVCQNLSFDRLYEVSHELTELLRDRTGEQPGIPEAMEKVTEVYEMTIEEIKKGL